MKKIKLVLAAMMILFVATSCESFGLFGQGGIKGSKVKAEILSIANQNNIIIGSALRSYYGSATNTLIVLNIVIDGAVVPGLAGISDSAHYTKGSVDSCKSKMTSVGLLLGNWFGAISCNLDKVPVLIQVGDDGI